MFNDLCGFGWSMGGLPYGNTWRDTRKMTRHSLHSHSVSQYRPHQLKTTRRLLLDLLNDAGEYSKAVRLWAGSTILSVSFDIDVQTHIDYYFVMAETASRFTIDQLAAGSRLVDVIPILKHIPEWFPGAAFKREASRIHAIADRMLHDPLNLVHSRMKAGHLGPCAAKSLIEAYGEGSASVGAESTDYVIRSTLGSLYIAGAETNIAALQTYFLAMVLYPCVQRTAWEEIDRVVGPHRLPDFRDQAALPYITAVMKETLRWRPVAPLAVPHMATEDDTYGDYFIPKGSIVVANSWSILHDESVYSNPSDFNPDRFLNADGTLNPEVQDPTVAAFGFGRRICPGRFLALESLWIGIVSILATFEIARAVDENGTEIVPDGKFTGGVISSPKPFRCNVRPRSKEQASLLQYVDLDEQDV
ncbi:cytochrome P450 [Daedaleopsis nitida]|nr:cytochrome P450 [Daedaleopsis nitida]